MKILIVLSLIIFSGASLASSEQPLASGFYQITNDAFLQKGLFLTADGNELVMKKLTSKSDPSKQWKMVKNKKNGYIISNIKLGNRMSITGAKGALVMSNLSNARDQTWTLVPVNKGVPIYRIHNMQYGANKVLDTHSSGSNLMLQDVKKRTPGTFWRFIPIKRELVFETNTNTEKETGSMIGNTNISVKPIEEPSPDRLSSDVIKNNTPPQLSAQ